MWPYPSFSSWVSGVWKKLGELVAQQWPKRWVKIVVLVILSSFVVFSVNYFTGSSPKQPQKTQVAIPPAITTGTSSGLVAPIAPLRLETDVASVAKSDSGTHDDTQDLFTAIALIVIIPTFLIVVWVGWKKIKKASVGGLPDDWYKNPTVFVFLGMIMFNLLFGLFYPDVWLGWFGHQRLFWTINLGIVVATFFLSFENYASRFVGLLFLGVITYGTLDAWGKLPLIERWLDKREPIFGGVSVSRGVPTPQDRGGWRKPPGVKGKNPEVRQGNFDVKVVRIDDNIFEFYVNPRDSGSYEAQAFWDRKKTEHGTWDKLYTHEKGEWFLKETSPGSGMYEGKYTDSSLKGAWIDLWLEHSK